MHGMSSTKEEPLAGAAGATDATSAADADAQSAAAVSQSEGDVASSSSASSAAAVNACVVCFEPLAARDGAHAADAGTQLAAGARASALPSELPCGHDCCVACMRQYLALQVPRALRVGSPPRVLCPGLSFAGGAAS